MVKFGIMIGMVGGLSIALLNAISQMNFGINVNFNFPSLQLPNLANNAPVTSAENNTGGGSENDGGFLPNLPLPELSLPKRSQFYFLADSAFSSTEGAKIRVDELKANGYKRAGLFNASDYPNLFGDNYVQVYVNTFTNKDACVNELKRYGKQKLDAYCARASVDANVSHEMIDTSQVMLEASPGNSEMDANNSEPSWLDRVQNWLNW
jgi:serine/threonine-protein kinase